MAQSFEPFYGFVFEDSSLKGDGGTAKSRQIIVEIVKSVGKLPFVESTCGDGYNISEIESSTEQ